MLTIQRASAELCAPPPRGTFVHDVSDYMVVCAETEVQIDGETVARFCKNRDVAAHVLHRAVTANQRRGWAAGVVESHQGDLLYKYNKTYVPLPPNSNVKAKRNKDGKLSPYNEGNKVYSGHFGYCETGKNHRANVRAGQQTFSSCDPVQLHRPYAWVKKHPQLWNACAPYFDSVNLIMKQSMPKQWHLQKELSELSPVRMGESVWTTGAVNRNFQTACHLDTGDCENTFSSLTTHGDFTGGAFLLPQLKLAFDVRPSDVLFCKTNVLWHCNAPIVSGERLSVVSYLRQKLVDLHDSRNRKRKR